MPNIILVPFSLKPAASREPSMCWTRSIRVGLLIVLCRCVTRSCLKTAVLYFSLVDKKLLYAAVTLGEPFCAAAPAEPMLGLFNHDHFRKGEINHEGNLVSYDCCYVDQWMFYHDTGAVLRFG